MAKKAKQEPRTQAWLASKLTGQSGEPVTQQYVSKLINSGDWRWPKRNWTDAQVAEIQASIDGSGDGDELGDEVDPRELLKRIESPEKRIKLTGVIERAAKARVDRELLLGGYVKKEDVERGRIERVQAVKQELMNVRLLALRMEGLGLQAREAILEEWARGVCGKFSRNEG